MSPLLRWFCAGVVLSVSLWVSCASADQDAGRQHRDGRPVEACLASMEAAMRAMDAFVPKRPTDNWLRIGDTDDLVIHHCDDACQERRIIEQAERDLQAVKHEQTVITQWATVKQQCWSQP